MTPDYFPLEAGRVLEYATRTPDGEGAVTVEMLSVAPVPGGLEARCRRTVRAPGQPDLSREFTAFAGGDGVRCDGELEFPLPSAVGRSWKRYPRGYSIESLAGSVKTPAGSYLDCLVVAYAIAGGDAGFGRRYYAPGVGFVREECADEADPYEVTLERAYRR